MVTIKLIFKDSGLFETLTCREFPFFLAGVTASGRSYKLSRVSFENNDPNLLVFELELL